MMKCVTCNKFSLFAPKQGGKKSPDFLQMQDINTYMKLKDENTKQLQNNCSVPFNKNIKRSMSKIVLMMITNGPYTYFM